jgi:hypothetical protein
MERWFGVVKNAASSLDTERRRVLDGYAALCPYPE